MGLARLPFLPSRGWGKEPRYEERVGREAERAKVEREGGGSAREKGRESLGNKARKRTRGKPGRKKVGKKVQGEGREQKAGESAWSLFEKAKGARMVKRGSRRWAGS